MTCGCGASSSSEACDCISIEAVVDAVGLQMTAAGNTVAGVQAVEGVAKKASAVWNQIRSLGTAPLSPTFPSSTDPAVVFTCTLRAWLRFLRQIQLCGIIPAGPERDSCMADAKAVFEADAAECAA